MSKKIAWVVMSLSNDLQKSSYKLVTDTQLNLLEWIPIVTVLLFGLRLSNQTHGHEHIF